MSQRAERKALERMSGPYRKQYKPFIQGDSIAIVLDINALEKHGITKNAVKNDEIESLDEHIYEDDGEIRIDLTSDS